MCKSDAIGAAMNSFWAIWCHAATFATERRDLDMWGRIAATSTRISFWIYKVVPTIIYNVLPSLKCGWWGQASACKWVGSRVGGAESPFRTIQISSKTKLLDFGHIAVHWCCRSMGGCRRGGGPGLGAVVGLLLLLLLLHPCCTQSSTPMGDGPPCAVWRDQTHNKGLLLQFVRFLDTLVHYWIRFCE